jgi:hypothetical protein
MGPRSGPWRGPAGFAILLTLSGVHVPGCTRGDAGPTATPRPLQSHVAIDFPESLRADHPTVNAFIEEVIRTCIARDYEAFRLLWRVEEKPMSQQEFLRGWEAAEEVRVLQLQQWQTEKGELLYAARGIVRLNPNEVPNPEIEITLLIVQENGKWRLARGPRGLAQKMQERAEAEAKGLAASNGLPVTTNGVPANTSGVRGEEDPAP